MNKASICKTLIAAALAALPVTTGAHGVGFHLGYGFWHDMAHLAPLMGGGLLAAGMIVAFLRWEDSANN